MIEKQVQKLISDAIEKENFYLDKVEYVKEGSQMFLRIIIDKEGIVDVSDTVKVFHIVSKILDEKDPINDAYILDVCSKEKGRE